MSYNLKVTTAVVSVMLSAFGTAATVIWQSSAKASEIETSQKEITAAKADIERVRSEVKDLQKTEVNHGETLARLDERTLRILTLLESRK